MADDRKTKVWEAVKVVNAFRWIFNWPVLAKVVGLMLPLISAGWFFYKGLSWPVVILLPLVIVMVALVIVLIGYVLWDKAKTPPYVINVDYTHNDGWAKYHAITFTNNGESKSFTADVQILRSNRPPNHPKGRFRLGWEDGTKSSVQIDKHLSARLLIADFEESIPNDMWTLNLKSLSEGRSCNLWYAKWLHGDPILPSFDVRVTLMAEGAEYPWTRCFSVSPESSVGPILLKDIGI
jgi:hypothetical protein